MLDAKLLEQLSCLKEFEEIRIGDKYVIQLKYLTLEHILKYSKELENINKDQRNIILFIKEFDNLSKDVITIVNKENKEISLKSLPLTISVPLVTEWVEINFTQGNNLIVEPLEKMLSRLTGQKIDLKKLLGSLSALLSAAGTLNVEKSSSLELKK